MPSSFFIKSLQLGHYRHLHFKGKSEFSPGLNLLIGKNGSGKTTMLQMVREISQGGGDSSLRQLSGDEVINRLVLERPESPTSIEARPGDSQWSGWESLQDKVRFVTSDRRLANVGQMRSFIPAISEFEMSEPDEELNISEEFTKAIVAELVDRLRLLGQGLEKITGDIESEYRSALVDFGKDIAIDFDRDQFVYFVDHNNEEVPINALSAGEKEYLYFYSYLRRIKDDRNRIILIDEPELHLHSSQVIQICDLLAALAEENQVIAATHSSEVLQYFLPMGEIILLSQGHMANVSVPEDMRAVIEQLGMPLDPSAFTAEWVVAENDSTSRLPGSGAPNTETVLTWLLGTSLGRRYWAFGSSRAAVTGADQALSMVAGDQGDMRISVLFDGDRRCVSPDTFPPEHPELAPQEAVFHLPCWELENLFLSDSVLNALEYEGTESLVDKLWRLVDGHKEQLLRSVQKTVTKNAVRAIRPDQLLDTGDPNEGLAVYKERIGDLDVNAEQLEEALSGVINDRIWQWLPGKEALGLLVGDVHEFWKMVNQLDRQDRTVALQTGIAGSRVAELQL